MALKNHFHGIIVGTGAVGMRRMEVKREQNTGIHHPSLD